MDANVLVVALAILGFALLAGRLEGTSITMPMLFTAAGLLLGQWALGILDVGVSSGFVSGLAEATLVVVLFTDASRIDVRRLGQEHSLALRLLGIGLPLAIAIGGAAAWLFFPALSLPAAGLLAVTLAPTDAALGQSFVTNTAVPQRIRQTLNVESGLNDGLAVPFLTVFLDLAEGSADTPWHYVVLFLRLVGVGMAVGAMVGWVGGRLLTWSAGKDWATASTRRLATLALAAMAYAGSGLLGGNGFVAAFVAGLAVGTTARELLKGTADFAEAEGQLLTLLTFLLFGSVVGTQIIGDLSWAVAGYAVLSLVIVRPVAVAISLVGSKVAGSTAGFIGWAGPRGLASIVYAVLIADAGIGDADKVFLVAAWTIMVSIVAHGVSAAPLSTWYGARISRQRGPQSPESQDVPEFPVRNPPRHVRRTEPD